MLKRSKRKKIIHKLSYSQKWSRRDRRIRTEKDFKRFSRIIHNHGFNLIAYDQIWFEDVFIFMSQEEADLAYQHFEKELNCEILSGYWYGISEFCQEAIKYYRSINNYNNLVTLYEI